LITFVSIMFVQTHEPGELGIADFTWVKAPVTIAGAALPHKLFHYRLVASGWAYAQVAYGGESFSALSHGFRLLAITGAWPMRTVPSNHPTTTSSSNSSRLCCCVEAMTLPPVMPTKTSFVMPSGGG